jgi:hypothetical protein
MSAEQFAPIKPQALAWIDRTMPRNRAGRPSEDVELTTQANEAICQLQRNVARMLGDSVDTAPLSDRVVSGGVIKGLDTPEDDKMAWLGDHASSRAVERLQTMARETTRARDNDTSATGRGRVGVRPDQDVIERLLASYSKQRQAVWWWCVDNASIITHDMPSARAVGKGAGVSYETARHVLTDWRNLYGLTLTPVNG